MPIIFIGNVRLRGNYLNIMFLAVAIDKNNHPLPIAFGQGVENNINSCTWFLMRFKEALEEGSEVTFLTNMDDSISSCIADVSLILIMAIILKVCSIICKQELVEIYIWRICSSKLAKQTICLIFKKKKLSSSPCCM